MDNLSQSSGSAKLELGWLSDWFAMQCDGVLEHSHGLLLRSFDNPGWLLEVDLAGTRLAGAPDAVVLEMGEPPSALNGNLGGAEWARCEVKGKKFIGAGDAHRLGEIQCAFRRWLEARTPP